MCHELEDFLNFCQKNFNRIIMCIIFKLLTVLKTICCIIFV